MLAQQTAYFNRQVNLSNYDPQPTFGRAVGGNFTWLFNKKYFLRLEFLNSYQGQKFSYNDTEVDTLGNPISVYLYTRRFDFNYYKYPILMGIRIHPEKIISGEIAIGPQIAYLNTAYYVLDADTLIRNDRSFKQTLKKIDPGLVLQAGIFTQPFTRIKLFLLLRFDISLFDADSKKFKPVIYATSKNFTGGISFGLSYAFNSPILKNRIKKQN